MKQILINNEELQTRVAVVEDGILEDFFMERSDNDSLVGSIFKAKIKNLEPSLQAAFVDLGRGKNAFLHYWDMLPASKEMLEDAQGGSSSANFDTHQLDTAFKEKKQASENLRKRRSRPPYRKKKASEPADKVAEKQPKPAAEESDDTSTGLLRRFFEKIFMTSKEPPAETKTTAREQKAPEQMSKRRPRNSSRKSRAPQADSDKTVETQQAQTARAPRNQRPPKPRKPSLAIADIPELFKVDQELLVQVTKAPIGNKGARVTTNLSIPGRFLVLLPHSPHSGISRRVEEKEERARLRQMMRNLDLPHGMGLICRTVAAGIKEENLQRDLDMLLDCWKQAQESAAAQRAPVCVYHEPDLAERILRDCLTEDIDEIIVDSEEAYKCATSLLMRYNRNSKVKVKLYQNPTPIFAKYGISKQIENISNRKVNLPGGGYICIDETEAMIAIDVNSGKNRSGKDHPETILNTNLEAVKEIARQLRLRNIGGLVVLDLIDMRSRKDQQTVYRTFKELLSQDRARVKAYPISPLGLLEMTRQRENESLESSIYDSCPYCKGRGLVKSSVSMSVEIQRRLNEILARRKNTLRLIITVHPSVMERLRSEDRKLMDSLAEEFQRQITFRADPALHIEQFKILDQDSGQEI